MSQQAVNLVTSRHRLRGSDYLTILMLAIRCDCRSAPFLVTVSTKDLAALIHLQKRRTIYILDSLIERGLIRVEQPANARLPATYQLLL